MQKFRVTPDDGESYEVQSRTRDLIQWEKTTKGASVGKLEQEKRMTDLYKIAWIAAKRTGQFGGTLADFETTCDIEAVSDEEPDPTRSEATAVH